MTLHTNYFVPTAAKGGGRKRILLKRINRHSAHVFRSHQMFSVLDKRRRASRGLFLIQPDGREQSWSPQRWEVTCLKLTANGDQVEEGCSYSTGGSFTPLF